MNLNFYLTKDYENKPRFQTPGKQTQFKANLLDAQSSWLVKGGWWSWILIDYYCGYSGKTELLWARSLQSQGQNKEKSRFKFLFIKLLLSAIFNYSVRLFGNIQQDIQSLFECVMTDGFDFLRSRPTVYFCV